MRIIGTCGACGGDVAVPDAWMSIYPPRPRCLQCKRVAKRQRPVIPMQNIPVKSELGRSIRRSFMRCDQLNVDYAAIEQRILKRLKP